jgi:methylated-DNA-[protein]-cysteine S-methyltransferase
MILFRVVPSPLGDLVLTGDDEAMTGLWFPDHSPVDGEEVPELFEDAAVQLEEWFAGERTEFDLRLRPMGTPFQQRVWEALLAIPYGRTTSYLEIASRAGSLRSARPAGQAIGRNPLSIIIPCHRVIGSNGSLTGYGGGMERKRWLLEHERRVMESTTTTRR